MGLSKKSLLSYIKEFNFGRYKITDLINTKDLFSCVLTNVKKRQKIIISYKEFEESYNQFNTFKIEKNIILYSDYYLEIPLKFSNLNEYMDNRTRWPIKIFDEINKIDYEIYYSSEVYNIYIINQIKKICDNNIVDYSKIYLFSPIHNLVISDLFNEDITKKYLFHNLKDCITLKISISNNTDLGKLCKLSESMIFNLTFNCNLLCKDYLDLYDYFNININPNNNNNKLILNEHITPPKRIYKEHVLDYYHLAYASIDPFTKYLSYYHVLEYFFDEVFNENLRKAFQNKITHPNFSCKNNNELDKVIDFIKKETRDYKKNGQGNELESLKLVLKKFINRGELQERLSPEQTEYYLKNKISFSHAPTISLKDTEGLYNHLAQRIYQTRNALVHSKEGNVERYKPYQDSEELSKEIPLIKLVAEQVIIYSSTPL